MVLGLTLVAASSIALADWATELAATQFFLNHWTRGYVFCLVVFLGTLFFVHRPKRGEGKVEGPPVRIVLVVLALLPVW